MDPWTFITLKHCPIWIVLFQNVQKLATLYEVPDDVDLTVGGSLEAHVPGTLAGPVFLCILTEQFYRTRAGDRYFYENGNPETGFTLGKYNFEGNGEDFEDYTCRTTERDQEGEHIEVILR